MCCCTDNLRAIASDAERMKRYVTSLIVSKDFSALPHDEQRAVHDQFTHIDRFIGAVNRQIFLHENR